MHVCVCVQMVSAERVMQYSALEPEAPLDTLPPTKKPPPDWPYRGEIVLDDVSFRYSEDTPTVLKSLSCTIKAAEKVSHFEVCAARGVSQLLPTGGRGSGWHSGKNWSGEVLADSAALPIGRALW